MRVWRELRWVMIMWWSCNCPLVSVGRDKTVIYLLEKYRREENLGRKSWREPLTRW
jgi:hypothetical protein